MAETKFVRVVHGEDSHFIALYTGLAPEELSRLLRAAYNLPHHVVGLMDKDSGAGEGVAIPISLACRTPEMLGERTYSLLLSDREVDWDRGKGSGGCEGGRKAGSSGIWEGEFTHSSNGSDTLGGEGMDRTGKSMGHEYHSGSTAGVRCGESDAAAEVGGGGERSNDGDENNKQRARENGEGGTEEERCEEEDTDGMHLLLSYITAMASKGALEEEEHNALHKMVMEGEGVIYSALSVAVYNKDFHLLAALLKDIVASRLNPVEVGKGPHSLEAKELMLDFARVLHSSDQVGEEELMYLSHLILSSSNLVVEAYKSYLEDADPMCLMDTLKKEAQRNTRLADKAEQEPGSHIGERTGRGSQTVSVDEGKGNDRATKASGMKVIVLKAAIALATRGVINSGESRLLRKMVDEERPVLIAAYE
ncbi:unnamed protein product, partial [Discosporangium mesarthrocarpum]